MHHLLSRQCHGFCNPHLERIPRTALQFRPGSNALPGHQHPKGHLSHLYKSVGWAQIPNTRLVGFKQLGKSRLCVHRSHLQLAIHEPLECKRFKSAFLPITGGSLRLTLGTQTNIRRRSLTTEYAEHTKKRNCRRRIRTAKTFPWFACSGHYPSKIAIAVAWCSVWLRVR